LRRFALFASSASGGHRGRRHREAARRAARPDVCEFVRGYRRVDGIAMPGSRRRGGPDCLRPASRRASNADDFSRNLIRARCEGRYATIVPTPLGVVSADLTAV
jgi:hypothetical protein